MPSKNARESLNPSGLSSPAWNLEALIVLGPPSIVLTFWIIQAAFLTVPVLLLGALTLAVLLGHLLLRGPWRPALAVVAGVFAIWGAVLLRLTNTENVVYLVAFFPFALAGYWLALLATWIRQAAPRYFNGYVLLVIMAMGLLLRLDKLTFTGFTYDEILTAKGLWPVNTFGYMLNQSLFSNDIPPLFDILIWFWAQGAGVSDFSLRLFAVLIGVTGIPAIYLLGKRLLNPTAGLIAAGLLCLNYGHLDFSQTARGYGMLVSLTCLSFWAYVPFLERPAWRTLLPWTLLNVALVYTHHFAWLVLITQCIDFTVHTFHKDLSARKRGFLLLGAGLVGVVAAYAPYVPRMLQSLDRNSFWSTERSPLFFWPIFNEYVQQPALALLLLGFMAMALFRTLPNLDEPRRRRLVFLVTLWLMLGLALPYLHTVFSGESILVGRYFGILLPPVLLMTAWGIASLQEMAHRTLALLVVGFLSLLALFAPGGFYERPSVGPFRDIAEQIPHEGNILYLCPPFQEPIFSYYSNKKNPNLWFYPATPKTLQTKLPPLLEEGPTTIWLIMDVYGMKADARLLRPFLKNFMSVDGPSIRETGVYGQAYTVRPERVEALKAMLKTPPREWMQPMDFPDAPPAEHSRVPTQRPPTRKKDPSS